MSSEYKDRLKARREGGMVERAHTVPHHGSYSVAAHSYNVAQIIITFHGNPSVELICAALDHDVPERWVGDTPSCAKWLSPDLKDSLKVAEEAVEDRFRIGHALTFEERRWLRAADILELYLWAQEQVFAGNRFCQSVIDNIDGYLSEQMPGWMPQPLELLYIEYNVERLPDLPNASH